MHVYPLRPDQYGPLSGVNIWDHPALLDTFYSFLYDFTGYFQTIKTIASWKVIDTVNLRAVNQAFQTVYEGEI